MWIGLASLKISAIHKNLPMASCSSSSSPETQQLISVRIPPGQLPGSSIDVQTVDGRIFAVTVPQGVEPGQLIYIEILDDTQSSTLTAGRPALPPAAALVLPRRSPAAGAPEEPSPSPSSSSDSKLSRAAVGATAVGVVLGSLLVGPVTGIVVGGAALYASTREDRVGQAARATGGAVATAVQGTADAMHRHQVKDKVVAAGAATYHKVKEVNEDYKVTSTVASTARSAVHHAIIFNERYEVLHRTSVILKTGAAVAGSALASIRSATS